jgi:succinyl-diaminopimelate desuccinylase
VLDEYGYGIVKGAERLPISIDADSQLVTTLMKVYQAHTGDMESKPLVIGGGTYARSMDNIVAFGARFPGEPELGHMKNEKISVDNMVRLAKIYAEAVYELAKKED